MRSRALAWCLLFVWALWGTALQAVLAPALGPWIPEIGLVIAAALAARFPTDSLLGAALAVAAARSLVSITPSVALFAGALLTVLWVRAVRLIVAVDSAPIFAALVFVGVAFDRWVAELAGHVRAFGEIGAGPGAFTRVLLCAASSALVALLLGAFVPYLPGLAPLRRRKVWGSAVSGR